MSCKRNLPQTVATKSGKSDFYDLPIVTDIATQKYARLCKVMLVFQGTSLKNASPIISKLKSLFESTAFIINDHSDVYVRGPPLALLKQRAKQAVENGTKLVVVNSSFCNLSLNRYYAALANRAFYITLVIPPVMRMPNGEWFRSNTYIPLFSAWYLNDTDSDLLCKYAEATIMDAYEQCPAFLSNMTEINCLPDNFAELYQLQFTALKSCVAKVFASKSDIKKYFETPAIKNNYGKVSKLEIAAIVITPDSIYAKIKLSPQQKELFGLEEKMCNLPNYPSILEKHSLRGLPDVIITYHQWQRSRTLGLDGRYGDIIGDIASPEFGKFGLAHINLGCDPTSPVQRMNIDAELGEKLEEKILNPNIDLEMHEIEDCYLKRIEDFWFIYFKHRLTVDAVFTYCCKLQ